MLLYMHGSVVRMAEPNEHDGHDFRSAVFFIGEDPPEKQKQHLEATVGLSYY